MELEHTISWDGSLWWPDARVRHSLKEVAIKYSRLRPSSGTAQLMQILPEMSKLQ